MSLNIRGRRVELGLREPVRILQISDLHLCYTDARDGEEKRRAAQGRMARFHGEDDRHIRNLREAIRFARERGDFLLHTGDMSDFSSLRNFEIARRETAGLDWLFAPGNHDVTNLLGDEVFEDGASRGGFDLARRYYPNDMRFCSRVIGGVNLVALNDADYHFPPRYREALDAEIAKGFPVILAMHIPLHAPGIPGNALYYACAPEAELLTYSPENRARMTPTPEDREFVRFLTARPQVRCILAGHFHDPRENRMPNGAMQYVAGGLYDGFALEIEFV